MSFVQSTADISPLMSVTAGAFSGLIVRFVVAPIDIVKIRLQLYNGTTHARYHSIFSTVSSICKEEGIFAFWKGNVPAGALYVVYGASQFTAFTSISNIVSMMEDYFSLDVEGNVYHAGRNTFVGASAGSVATCVSYPLDLLRTRLASNESKSFHRLGKEIRDIWQDGGITGFFRGSMTGVAYVAMSTGLSFGSYSVLMREWEGTQLENWSGVCAGVFSKTIVYPLDLMKRRMQMGWQKTLWKTLQSVVKEGGVRGLYRGLFPALLKSAPATGVSLYCYEFFVRLFKKHPF